MCKGLTTPSESESENIVWCFAAHSLIFSDCSLIFFAFSFAFAWCGLALGHTSHVKTMWKTLSFTTCVNLAQRRLIDVHLFKISSVCTDPKYYILLFVAGGWELIEGRQGEQGKMFVSMETRLVGPSGDKFHLRPVHTECLNHRQSLTWCQWWWSDWMQNLFCSSTSLFTLTLRFDVTCEWVFTYSPAEANAARCVLDLGSTHTKRKPNTSKKK